jgi:hypothetical protein
MKTIATFAFFFYFLWAPAFTIGAVLLFFRKLKTDAFSIPWFVAAIAVMTLVAGPVSIEGPLPGFMPWWAVGFIAWDQRAHNYVVYYALLVTAIFVVKYIREALTGAPRKE